MPISPHQVTSRANSDLLRIDRISEGTLSPVERMVAIVQVANEFRAAVHGSTADPLRDYVPPALGEPIPYVPIPGLSSDPADALPAHIIPGPVGVGMWGRVLPMQEPSNLVYRVQIVMAEVEIAHYDFADTDDHLRLPYAETPEIALRLGIEQFARALRGAVA